MKSISIIVAMANARRVIGAKGKMPWPKIPSDIGRFKGLTYGHAVIMGRATWDSLPEAYRPLPDRANIVITRNSDLVLPKGAHRASSPDNALELVNHDEEAFIIGGEEIYRAYLNMEDLVDRIHITRVHGAYEGDRRFPECEDEFNNIIVEEIREATKSVPATTYQILERS